MMHKVSLFDALYPLSLILGWSGWKGQSEFMTVGYAKDCHATFGRAYAMVVESVDVMELVYAENLMLASFVNYV